MDSLPANTSYQMYVVAYGEGSDESAQTAALEYYTHANVPSALQVHVFKSSVTVTWSGDGTQYDAVRAEDVDFSVNVATVTLSAVHRPHSMD